MSQERNIKWLNSRRVIYRQLPINDIPTIETNKYMFFENGTYEHYSLFNTKAKITTYKSLKWHFLVLYYLNQENGLLPTHVYEFIANKENGFVTFFISKKVLNDMIDDVFKIGGEPPVNKVRKVIFKDYSMLTINEKLSIVGKLIGRSSRVDDEAIYQCMLDLNDLGKHICIGRIAGLLNVSKRTIYRHINDELKQEIKILNEEI
jgi:DNA-binding transcriptional ArsR family regulator